MSAFELKKSAKTSEAQTAAGHSRPQWDRFYVRWHLNGLRTETLTFAIQHITKLEIDSLMKDQPDLTWRTVPADTCIKMQERVNVELAREHIPTIKIDAVQDV
jgi:hypothetical protein